MILEKQAKEKYFIQLIYEWVKLLGLGITNQSAPFLDISFFIINTFKKLKQSKKRRRALKKYAHDLKKYNQLSIHNFQNKKAFSKN